MLFADDMKKESKMFGATMVLCAILAIFFPTYFTFIEGGYPLWQIVLAAVFFFILFAVSLYAFLYSTKYKVEGYADKIIFRSLFGRKTIAVADITEYEFLKNYTSGFYQYKITYNTADGSMHIKLSTRCPDIFTALLKNAQVKEILK